jgi:DNA-binding NtrC family response regulator
MPAILIICSDEPFRSTLREAIGNQHATVVGVPNTRDILTPQASRHASGYDLIVAEVHSNDHDGLSRLVLFRNLHPNTPFLAVTREEQSKGLSYSQAAARALHAQLIALPTESLDELKDAAAHALPENLPSSQSVHSH